MILRKNKLILACLLLAITFSACVTTPKTYNRSDIAMPNSYKGRQDSNSLVKLKPEQFFVDKELVNLIDTALVNNADLKIALQRVEAARANLLMSKGSLYPSLDVNASAGVNKYGKYTMNGLGNEQTNGIPSPVTPDYLLGFNSSWEVDIWGKIRNRKVAAQNRFLATEAGRNYMVTSLLSEVAYRYYSLASLNEELKIIRDNIKLQEQALEVVKLQKEGGRATSLAVKQFEAQVMKTRSMEYEVKQDITTNENELNFLLGRYPQTINLGIAPFNPDFFNTPGNGIPTDLLQNRPDIVAAELELSASRADVAAAKAAFLPSVNIMASAGYNSFNTSMLFNPASFAYGVLGGITGPVFNKNVIKANYNVMLANHKGAYYQYGKTVMNAVYEVISSVETMENLKAQYQLAGQQAASLNDAVSIANDLYMAGYANYLEVITAQKNALEAELDVVKARKKILFSRINLYRSLGGGWVK